MHASGTLNIEQRRKFNIWHFKSNLGYTRMYFFLFMIGYPLFGLMDYFGTGDAYESILVIRLVVGLPPLIFAYVSTFYHKFDAHHKLISGLALFIMNITIPIMYGMLPSDSPDASTYYAGFMITLASMGISFGDKRIITVSMFINCFAFCFIAFWVHDLDVSDPNLFAKTFFYLLTVSIFFSFTAHLLEGKSVMLYLAQQEIELEKSKVELRSEKLASLNKVKNRFFTIISHDLRTPFNSMLGYFEVKLLESEKSKVEIDSSILRMFYLETRNTYDFLDNLLCWSKSQMDNNKVEKREYSIKEIYDENILLFETQASQKQITIDCKISADTIAVCNREMIGTVLRNLISNAIKYSDKTSVVVEAFSIKNKVVVKVIDYGVGLSNKQIRDLQYSIYSNVSIGTNGEKGAGTGLLICHDFLKEHSSALNIISELNVGSEFSFMLDSSN